jgi:hypothetical protein
MGVTMYDEGQTDETGMIDWAGTCRLALVVSVVAGAAALLLSSIVGETALVVSVIVGGTAASWFHLEQHTPIAEPLTELARRD